MAGRGVPKFLFRYRREDSSYFWEELERAIGSREFYFASAELLNDPFEIRPTITKPSPVEFLKVLEAKYGKNSVISRVTLEKYYGEKLTRQKHRRELKGFAPSLKIANWMINQTEQTFSKMNSRTRVVCFNETPMSLPMWAHYANNHRGICLSFEQVLQEHIEPDLVPMKVSYSSERPILDIGEFESASIGGEGFSPESALKFASSMYLTKAADWSYEKEWRAFDNDGLAPDYERMSVLKPHSIILGMNASKDLKDKIIEMYGKRMRLLEAQSVGDKYELAFKNLN